MARQAVEQALGHALCSILDSAEADLNAWVTDHLVQMEAMGEDELRNAAFEPARLAGLDFEKGLVGQILEDVRSAVSELPLIEHALLELYDKRSLIFECMSSTIGFYRELGLGKSRMKSPTTCWRRDLYPVNCRLRRLFQRTLSASVEFVLKARALRVRR